MSPPAPRPLAWSAATILATVAIGLVAFLPMLGNTFWRDDFEWVSNGIRASRDPAYLLTPIAMFFRPLVNLTFTLNFLLARLDPAGYLAFNLAVHLLNAVLVAWLARRLAPDSPWIGPIAGMLFAAGFGSFGEAVIWICGRTDLLLTTCLLAALHSHLTALDHGRLRDRIATLGWFVLALLTKETAVVVLPALVLLEWLHPSPRSPSEPGGLEGPEGRGRDALRRYAPFALLLVPYLVFEWVLQKEAPAMSHHVYRPGGHVLPHMAEYLVRMWVPVTPSSMILAVPAQLRGPLDATLRVLMVMVPLAWLALLVAPVPRAAKFGVLLMMVSVIPFSLFTWRTSTRYLYTPSVGWVLAVAFIGRELWRVLVGPLILSAEGARAPRTGSPFARRMAILSGLVMLAIAMVAQTVSVHYIIRGRHDLGRQQDPAELRAMTELARSLGY